MNSLIERIEGAEAGSRELDVALAIALGIVRAPRPGFRVNTDPYTTSLDAALALAERLFPAWKIALGVWSDCGSAHLGPSTIETTFAKTPALALCAALLRAKEQGNEHGA